MTGIRGFRQVFNLHLMREHRAAAAIALFLGLALHGFDLRAELFFRSLEKVDGQPRWSAPRKYGNPTDSAYARVPASGVAAPAVEVRVFISGWIGHEDVRSAGVMADLVRSGKQKIAGNIVSLAGHGGDVDAAMDLGRLLRKLGVFTLVGKKDQCLSACVFAFMGGERRSVAGRLGIHRPFLPFTQDTPDRLGRFRYLQKTLRGYFEELDFPASLYEAVMVVPPESMHMLAPADLKRFYLEGISPSSEDMADAVSARRLGISMADYLQRKAQAPTCAFPVAATGRCEDHVMD